MLLMLFLMLFYAMILTALINAVLALKYTGAPGTASHNIKTTSVATGCPSTKKVLTIKIILDLNQKCMK